MENFDLKIETMTCQHCVGVVTKALEAIAGVDKVEVNLKAGSAKVWGQAAKADLVAAVEKAGFTAS